MKKYAGLPILHIDNDITNDHKRLIVELFAVIFSFYNSRSPPSLQSTQNYFEMIGEKAVKKFFKKFFVTTTVTGCYTCTIGY